MNPMKRALVSSAGGLALIGLMVMNVGSSPSVVSAPSTAARVLAVHSTLISLHRTSAQPFTTDECASEFGFLCYGPTQLETAYNEQPLFNRGVTGAGQTIVIVDAFGSPTIKSDLSVFDETYGIPDPPSLKVIQPAGPVPPFDVNNSDMTGWAGETTLDVEYAHAMAPGANILLVETPVSETEGTAGFPQIVQAENYVINHHLGDVISQSFGATEETFPGPGAIYALRSAYQNAYNNGVTVLAATGDEGATDYSDAAGTTLFTYPVVDWPSSDPLVTAVGGTQLTLDDNGNRTAPDVVWNDTYNPNVQEGFFGDAGPNPLAGSGGKSSVFARPSYQDSVANIVGRTRGVPDISMSGACSGLVNTYESYPGVAGSWGLVCGTSESTPLFAGIVALTDQVAGHSLGLINPALYRLSAQHAAGLVDVTQGNNTVGFTQDNTLYTVQGYSAQRGYDLASGVGTVNAAYFVPELARASGWFFH